MLICYFGSAGHLQPVVRTAKDVLFSFKVTELFFFLSLVPDARKLRKITDLILNDMFVALLVVKHELKKEH